MKHVKTSFPRLFWYSACSCILYFGLSLFWLLFQPASPILNILVNFSIIPCGIILTLIVGLLRSRTFVPKNCSSRLRFAQRWGTVSFLGVMGCGVLAIAVFLDNIFVQRLWPPPFPAFSDVFYLLSMVFVLSYYLCIPSRPLREGAPRARILLQSLLILISLSLFVWYFLLAPMLFHGMGSMWANITEVGYLLETMIVVCVLVSMVSRLSSSQLRPTLILCWCSLLLVAATHVVDGIMIRFNSWALLPISVMLILGSYLCYGLATQLLRHVEDGGNVAGEDEEDVDLRSLLSPTTMISIVVLLLLLVLGLLLYVWSTGRHGVTEWGVYSGSALVIVLLFIRQVMIQREVIRYAQATRHLNQELQGANSRLATLATTDVLTNLPNHRALSERLEQEMERARSSGQPFSLLFFDGDRFKRINDTYGHAVGDAVLRELGVRASSILRKGDLVGRYGGEEFLVLLPDTDAQAAAAVAERLRTAVAAIPMALEEVSGGIAVTVSVGLAVYPDDGVSANELQEQADQAMYWAKRLGRNQVRRASEIEHFKHEESLAATIQHLERHEEPHHADRHLELAVGSSPVSAIQSFLWLLHWYDQSMRTHCSQLSDLATAIGRELALPYEQLVIISIAAFVHDIRHISLPEPVIQKQSADSTKEQESIQSYIRQVASIREVASCLYTLFPALQHLHENWDGTGSPEGLRAEAIPLEARLLRVCDAYVSMITPSVSHSACSSEAACQELLRLSGTLFDPQIVKIAIRVLSAGQENQQFSTPGGALAAAS